MVLTTTELVRGQGNESIDFYRVDTKKKASVSIENNECPHWKV